MLKTIIDTYIAPYKVLFIAGGIIVGIIILFNVYLFWQADSKVEKEATNANVNSTIANVQSNVQEQVVEQATESVEQAEKTSQKARKQRETAKQTNTTNTNYETANKERCATFPESEECK
jgi:small-conductance mechanosensitive channel